MTFAEKIITFNQSIDFTGELPEGIQVMNPFRGESDSLSVSSAFYRKFYNDSKPRHLILGINPGRFGAGVTGIPFTDTKRLKNECGLDYQGSETHEPSSVFVYEVIEAYGGAQQFYADFYINSLSPLGFTIIDDKGRVKNYNYYDSPALMKAVKSFIVQNIRAQIALGVETDVCFCFASGKNETSLRALTQEYGFFKTIIALEHPRFVMQYKSKTKQLYIDKYITAFYSVKEK